MGWYSCLSKTALEPLLVYEYSLAFSRNELGKEDLACFNHEFLQSMGISVAKHRLEILKLARKETGEAPNSLAKLILAINKTRKSVESGTDVVTEGKEREGADEDRAASGEIKVAKSGPLDYKGQYKLLIPPRRLKLSGPLDRKMQEMVILNYRSPITSGPTDIAMAAQERLMLTNGRRSPKLSVPLSFVRTPSPKIYGDHYNKEKAGENYDDQTLWAELFRDMRPT
ncbi:Major facilitator superfamily protein isoform 1 [Hibiscus syriacus]|uniref:Major facilitator superfamily protein isoform 1 n=1 Tax=Hibiscus syriacus TaxID=106335 RepID=A0A6A2ZAL7_HIBSY|nr:uncharacterized protein LOC120149234 [Hibiscus syriacus]KAE8688145.1 Major facilitator superfamily protein isoform 1 [Hibiscus syriacus]